jgi:ribonuclease P protein component
MFPRQHRLKKETDIKRLFSQQGRGVFDGVCGIKYARNALGVSRFTVILGGKVSKSAVVRNRLRRQIREIVRRRLTVVKPGFDVAFLVRPAALGKSYQDLETAVVGVLKKARLLST